MESDDEYDTVWIPRKENGEQDMDWWQKEMLKRPDKYTGLEYKVNGETRYSFIPRSSDYRELQTEDNSTWKRMKDDRRNETEKKKIVESEKPKEVHQMSSEDKRNQMEKKETPVTKKPKKTASLTKSIGMKWRSFKKNVLFSKNEMVDKSDDAKMSPHEPLDPVTFLNSTEIRQLIESIVQVAVDKRINEMTDGYSTSIKKLEKDLEEQQELVKKLEESLKCERNIPKDPVELEEAELKKLRRTLVVIGVPEIHSDSDHEKNLADIERIGRILKELEIETTPVSVYRMGDQKKDGKPRMLKVVMPSAHDQRKVLRQAMKLRKYHGWGPIKMTTSLSTE